MTEVIVAVAAWIILATVVIGGLNLAKRYYERR